MDTVRKSDRFIPWYFVAFFVGLAIWDGIFVYVATTTHTGVVTDKSYDRGINYNETIAAAEAQSALGWAGEIEFKNGQLASLLTDANGRAIVGARVDAHFFRPTQAGGDFTINLTEVSDGRYVSSALSAAPGQWEVRVFVEWKQKQFQTAERIVVPQQ